MMETTTQRGVLAYATEALDAVEPFDVRVLYAIASTESSVLGSITLRLSAAFASMSSRAAGA
jgi:hypothetical protein